MCSYSLTIRTSIGLNGWCPWVTQGKRSRSPDRSEIQQSNGHLSAPELQGIQAGRLHIILKPQPPADLTNSSTLSHPTRYTIASLLTPNVKVLVSLPVPSLIPTLRILRVTTQEISGLRRTTSKDRKLTAQPMSASPQPKLGVGEELPYPSANSDLFTSTNKARISCFWRGHHPEWQSHPNCAKVGTSLAPAFLHVSTHPACTKNPGRPLCDSTRP